MGSNKFIVNLKPVSLCSLQDFSILWDIFLDILQFSSSSLIYSGIGFLKFYFYIWKIHSGRICGDRRNLWILECNFFLCETFDYVIGLTRTKSK